MDKLIYSMSVSADGYIVGPDGKFDWAMPDEEFHRFHNEQTRALAGHLLGRRLYETMVYWETADKDSAAGDIVREFALIVGGGRRFFPPKHASLELELLETRSFASRVVYLRYRRLS